MTVEANRRRFIALATLALAAGATRPLRAQGTPQGPLIDGKLVDQNQTLVQYIGSWHLVSQMNVSRAWIRDGVGAKAGGIREGDRLTGGRGEINIEYFSGEGVKHGYSGTLTLETVGAIIGGFKARVFIDEKEVDSFMVDESAQRDVAIWFGKDLAGLVGAKIIRVDMNVAGTDYTVFEAPLEGTAEALAAMKTLPDYNYNVRGIGQQPPGPPGGQGGPSGGCYLTTACCAVVGLDDDCFELAALRRFRDDVMARTEEGRRDIRRYYDLAPLVLAAMDRRGEERRLLALYFSHILPSAVLARLGFKALPRRLYSSMTRRLVSSYLPERGCATTIMMAPDDN